MNLEVSSSDSELPIKHGAEGQGIAPEWSDESVLKYEHCCLSLNVTRPTISSKLLYAAPWETDGGLDDGFALDWGHLSSYKKKHMEYTLNDVKQKGKIQMLTNY